MSKAYDLMPQIRLTAANEKLIKQFIADAPFPASRAWIANKAIATAMGILRKDLIPWNPFPNPKARK